VSPDAFSGDVSTSDEDTQTAPDGLAELAIRLDTTALEVGQTLPVAMSARNQQGEDIEGVSVSWHSSNESAAAFGDANEVSAIAAGTAEIWATAGDIESNRLSLEISALDPGEPRYVVVKPQQVALAPGNSQAFRAEVRRSDGSLLEGLEVQWSSSDETIVTVDETGKATAAGGAEGRADVTATLDNGTSVAAQVAVTAGLTWIRPGMLRPSGHVVMRGEPIELEVDLREVAVSSPDGSGFPVQPDSVEIMAGDTSLGNAAIEWERSSFTIERDVQLGEGLYELRARISYNDKTYTTPTRMLSVQGAEAGFADQWTNLHRDLPDDRWARDDELGPTNGNTPAVAVDSQNGVYVALESPNRGDQAKIYVRKWNEDDKRWSNIPDKNVDGSSQGLQLSTYNTQYDFWPSNTAQFVDLAVDGQGRLLLVYTQEAADDGGNGDEREKRWFDVFVLRQEPDYGPGGTPAWRLLTSGQQDYLFDASKDDAAQHPMPADVDERDDVFTPQVMWDATQQRVAAAWISSPFPREKIYLDVRYWSDSSNSWTTLGERLELAGIIPELQDAYFDAQGRFVATIENAGETGGAQYEIWRLADDGGDWMWSRVDATGRLAALSSVTTSSVTTSNMSTPSDSVTLGVSALGTTLRGISVGGSVATAGTPLNRSSWAAAQHPTFVEMNGRERMPYVLWSEGPIGSNQWFFGAHYTDAGWTGMDIGLFTKTRGDRRLSAAAGPDGRLVVVRQAPHADKEDQYSVVVVRSRGPILE
jgi:hypothetical protein